MPVRATVLVALDENRLAACDQKARRRIAREIVVHGQVQTSVRDARLSDPHEARGKSGRGPAEGRESSRTELLAVCAIQSLPRRPLRRVPIAIRPMRAQESTYDKESAVSGRKPGEAECCTQKLAALVADQLAPSRHVQQDPVIALPVGRFAVPDPLGPHVVIPVHSVTQTRTRPDDPRRAHRSHQLRHARRRRTSAGAFRFGHALVSRERALVVAAPVRRQFVGRMWASE